MTDSSTRHPYSNNDELDLGELLHIVWKGRYILLLCSLAGLLLAGLYAFTAKEQWSSVTYISKPYLEQIGPYLDQRRSMARVDGNKSVNSSELASSLFGEFISQAAAMKNRLEYLSQTDYYKELLKDKDDPTTGSLLLTNLADQLLIKAYDKEQIAPYYELSFTAETAEQAQGVLIGYLAWVNDLSFKLIDESFNNHLDAQILSRQTELENIDFELKTNRQNKMEHLENALHTARLANIKDYVIARQTDGATVIELSDSKRLFMLGEKYLNAELKSTQETPLVYPPRYYEIQRELEQLEPLRKYDVKTLSYSYQLAPTLPVTRDKPKRSLIMALGIMAGGLLGGFGLLISNSFRRQEYGQRRFQQKLESVPGQSLAITDATKA